MSQRQSQSSAEEHLIPMDSHTPSHPPSATGGEGTRSLSSSKASIKNNDIERPFRHFWKRTLTLILFPLAMTIYFFIIWRCFSKKPEDPVKYGAAGEIWIFYSWFVISVFALEWSKYALAGVEAAMLQTAFWRAPNFVALLMHSESLWSGPDGWWECLSRLVRPQKRLVHRLWLLLAILSLFAFVAVPLSGLSFEMADGYVPLSDPPIMIGRTWENFNRRQDIFYNSGALKGWTLGSPTTIPGFGVIYTPAYFNRELYSGFGRVPNTLPLAESIPEMFIAPQAMTPVSGRVWGLHATYNCSAVKNASEFTILNQKSSSSFFTVRDPLDDDRLNWTRLRSPSEQPIYLFSSSSGRYSTNLWGYAEIGLSNSSITYDGTESSSLDQDGLAKADVLEYSLWQARLQGEYDDSYIGFDSTLDPTIDGMAQPIIQDPNNGTFVTNRTFFKIKGNDGSDQYNDKDFITPSVNERIKSLAPTIGMQCRAASTLGTAALDPAQSTFHSFERTPSPPFNASEEKTRAPRFGNIALATILGQYSQIFLATNSPAPIPVGSSYLYRNFVQPQMLQRSIMLAYAMDALQLMYDGMYGFDRAWRDDGLTSSERGKVLVTGVVPQWIPAICFAVWAVGSVVLGILYGFRRRWSDSLDGYSFLRFGVELADDLKGKPDFMNASEFYHSRTLGSLPGLIGDMKGNRGNGYRSMELDDMARERNSRRK
ncbi:hypothetical protein GGS26DRAFT_582303 [Hypomontagnella submonticulosa]|nr:hypothetical protein GGS26DRAFT_582303 [Hypomontagnella submonticulosa]